MARVRVVKSAQRLGFSLDQFVDLLRLKDGTRCCEGSGLAKSKLLDIREKLVDLERSEAARSALMAACGMLGGNDNCPLIASLKSHIAPMRSRSESQECAQ